MAEPGTGLWFPNLLVANDLTWTNIRAVPVLGTWDPDIDLALGYNAGESGQQVADHEASGTGYTAGGQLISNHTKSVAGGRFYLSADTLVFTSVALSNVKHVVFYDDDGTSPVANPIIAVFTYTDLLTNSGGNFVVPLPDTPVTNCIAAVSNPGV